MADQVSTRLHPHCQQVYDRLDALSEVTQTLRFLADTDDPDDARRAARYLEAAVIGAAEDITALTRMEVSHA